MNLLAKRFLMGVTIGAVSLMGVACGDGEEDGEGVNTELEGVVKIDGSSTVAPISKAAATAFKEKFPKVDVTVATSGTGGGFGVFTKGETDIQDASRPIKAKEFNAAKENGIEFIEVPIALDGLSVVVNQKNDWVDSLTVDQLKQIFLEKDIMWSDVVDGGPSEKIVKYIPGSKSGTFDYMKEVLIGKSKELSFQDASPSEDDNVLVKGIEAKNTAIGFFGYSYYLANKEKLRAVSIVNPKTGKAVPPSAETVIDGTYAPLSRPLFIYISTKSMERPEVKQFVNFYLEGAAKFAESVGYVAVPEAIAKSAKDFVSNGKAGTTYLEGEKKREGGVTAVYKEGHLQNIK